MWGLLVIVLPAGKSALLTIHYSSFLARDTDAASQSEQRPVSAVLGGISWRISSRGTAGGSGARALPALLSISEQ